MGTIYAADLFAGAGGASQGLIQACEETGHDLDLVAVNHWETAVDTHRLNHPGVRHLCMAVEQVIPRHVVPGGRLDILLAGPACQHHSRARGGRPMEEQPRAHAWSILKWLEDLWVETVVIENVPEFETWGPLDDTGHPVQEKKGQTFAAFIAALRSLDYAVEWKVLNAADFGDPTTRRRLFIIAQKTEAPIWPVQTHFKDGVGPKRWRAARGCLDLEKRGKSIYGRKKPLCANTMRRILQGLEEGGSEYKPYLVILRNNMGFQDIERPMPTVAAGGEHIAVVQLTHGGRLLDSEAPFPGLTGANRGEIGLTQFVLQQQSGGAPRSVDKPLPTIAGKGAQSLVSAFMVAQFGEREGQKPRVHSVDAPFPALTATKGGPALVQAEIKPVDEPGVGVFGPSPESDEVPFWKSWEAIEQRDSEFLDKEEGEPDPFFTEYYGTGGTKSIDAPMPPVTTHDRLGLVMPVVNGMGLDILFRMLEPEELALGQGFPKHFQFTGNRGARVKQIGNAWPVNLARSIIRPNIRVPPVARRYA